jgi:hypothetical protein
MMATVAAALLRLTIYYGYPSLVEGARGDVAAAANVFGRYDAVVFGDGLELPAQTTSDAGLAAERVRLPKVIQAIHQTSRRPRVYGYVDLGSSQKLTLAEIERRTDQWAAAGADGIFFDEAGNDFEVTPERRRAAVAAVHARHLSVFLNLFNVGDLEQDAAGLGSNDVLLLESFVVRNGAPEPAAQTSARVRSAVALRARVGVRLFAVTTSGTLPFRQEMIDEAWRKARSLNLDGFGWGERDFSADSRLPWRPRPEGAEPATR